MMNRRELIKLGLLAGSAAVLGFPAFRAGRVYGANPQIAAETLRRLASAPSREAAEDPPDPMPTSPFIIAPFTDLLPIPQPLAPSDPSTWNHHHQGPPNPAAHQVWQQPAVYYNMKLKVAPHSFSSSLVQRLDNPAAPPTSLPPTTIYGFNGTFPGPMIRAFYGKPALVRVENHLDENPHSLDRGDFGVETFLTHLHNGHTSPESDGNPNHEHHAYEPGHHCDHLYLNYPAGGDDREKQSFLWFHDHTMHNTATNVAKGMVGLYPIYDNKMDCGDETRGYRLPGFEYDIPLAFYDCRLDDGITPHLGVGQNGQVHPQNWGKLFFGHYHNYGFVGDVFTVNCKVQPYLPVKRRKYRFRLLDASIARWYNFMLMKGSVQAAPGVQGQYLLSNAEQVMRFTQVAGSGGLLEHPLSRNAIYMAPAIRKEVIIDFSQYMDGSPTANGDEIYLANTLLMTTGRKPDSAQDPAYIVPMLKFIIDGDPDMPDLSVIPQNLRELPPLPNVNNLPVREFELHRSNGMWMINNTEFDSENPIARPRLNSAEVWVWHNESGGWVHPMHIHHEEHQVLWRNGVPATADDKTKDDVIALEPGETVATYRQFRTFTGKYVGHCHNLSHEDHAMMFAWEITP